MNIAVIKRLVIDALDVAVQFVFTAACLCAALSVVIKPTVEAAGTAKVMRVVPPVESFTVTTVAVAEELVRIKAYRSFMTDAVAVTMVVSAVLAVIVVA